MFVNLVVEKKSLRFYKYKFQGFENKPIVIEAYNKHEAREKLLYAREKFPHLKNIPVVDESLSLPITGETIKIINNEKYVWMGNDKWIPLKDYEKDIR